MSNVSEVKVSCRGWDKKGICVYSVIADTIGNAKRELGNTKIKNKDGKLMSREEIIRNSKESKAITITHETNWYRSKMGKEFEVFQKNLSTWELFEKEEAFINKEHTKVLDRVA
ncbi:hypothetical protein [Poseidonibacter ostreae]|uniref:Uncharacterized protein n=1 Tax=Poseidonibacter ostreae TaxID=2654171 RepID=A0A6L4WX15_9BACT|nr:hypothetical protein [Poseidonibacter ostreae]KAB7891421.1 hypothetical protein GBG19_00870 [Poseidonibacter ostreae]